MYILYLPDHFYFDYIDAEYHGSPINSDASLRPIASQVANCRKR